MLRARPSNEVRASAERIGGPLQPLQGFCSASGSVRRPPAIDAMRAELPKRESMKRASGMKTLAFRAVLRAEQPVCQHS